MKIKIKHMEETKKSTKLVTTFLNALSSEFMQVVYTIVICASILYGVAYFIDASEKKNHPYGDYELTFRVYYDQNNVKEYTVRHNRPIEVGSNRGSNYVKKYNDCIVINTNAPIEVVKYVNHKK